MRAARRLLAMFGAEAKVKAPQCSSARAGRASTCVLGTLELLGHNTKRIFNELPLLVCLKKRDAKHGNVRRRRRVAREAALLVCFTPTMFVAVLLKVGNLGTHNSSFFRTTWEIEDFVFPYFQTWIKKKK